jgi:DNA-binding protein YbaB
MAMNGVPDRLSERLNQLSGIGSSGDRLVRVVVDGCGVPQSITIDPAATRLEIQALGDAFIAATKAALDDLQGQAAALIQGELADDALGPTPILPSEAVRQVNRRAEQAMNDFDAVRRQMLDRLPDA